MKKLNWANNHHILLGIFQFHNKSKFEIYAFSFGPKEDYLEDKSFNLVCSYRKGR